MGRLIIVLLLALASVTISAPAQADATEVQVWGHRGSRPGGGVTESTYEAYEAARKAGAYGIEVDLRETRTHYWVIAHDATMGRTSKNCDQDVYKLSYPQFKKCKPNSGSHFMSLKNTAKWAKKYKMHVDLDVKVMLRPDQAQDVYNVIKKQGAVEYFIPNGKNSADVLNIGAMKTGLVCPNGECKKIPKGVGTIKVDVRYISADEVKALHKKKYKVIAYGVTNGDLKRMKDIKIDGVMVDSPKQTIEELKNG